MDQTKTQLITRIKECNNVLVTVSSNPSVDQLSAAIGLTLLLNKLGKHGTAVFSGEVPSTLEFLSPEKTIEKNTDSLQDFIIALDKSKADKLRYKVEDSHVKIFITPYRTSITDKDLEFSQGDFNVELVIALGVHEQKDLDEAIIAHGRILHDATVASVNVVKGPDLGTINWLDESASSLCEMLVGLATDLDKNAFDGQMATALLTGIVAETDRFSNEKTSVVTMKASATLMAAGANQQLVASKLEEKQPEPVAPVVEEPEEVNVPPAEPEEPEKPEPEKPVEEPKAEEPEKTNDGSLQIEHELIPAPIVQIDKPEDELDQIHIDEAGTLKRLDELEPPKPTNADGSSHMVLEPPTLGGKLTANTNSEPVDPSTDPLSGASTNDDTFLTHDTDKPQPSEPTVPQQVEDVPVVPAPEENNSEPAVPPAADTASAWPPLPDLDAARNAVEDVAKTQPSRLEPVAALNAQHVDLQEQPAELPALPQNDQPVQPAETAQNSGNYLDVNQLDQNTGLQTPPEPQVFNPTAPPPVPPPMMPPAMPPAEQPPAA